MILADKIIQLRKQNHWSQEELAVKLGVSRQAISKWEGAQSIPDLERILKMSQLFGVSTDTLIKDELDLSSTIPGDAEISGALRILTMEEVNDYLNAKYKSVRQIAFGVMLCILAIIPLLLSETLADPTIAEPMSFSLSALMVMGAVALFILNGFRLKAYEWIENEPFETAYGVDGMVMERQKNLQPRRAAYIVAGVTLCFLTLICFFASDYLPDLLGVSENGIIALGFGILSIAVFLFILVGIPHSAYKKILQVEDYSVREKVLTTQIGPFMVIYWLIVVAVFLGYSFTTMDWKRGWIIWPVAGVLCGVLYNVLELFFSKGEK